MSHKTFLLLILDGFGISPNNEFNAITHANLATWNSLWQQFPHCLLDASGNAVGLPADQIGNSEVGHMTIGAGRTLYQDLTRIDHAISSNHFVNDPNFQQAIQLGHHHPIHLMGLLSSGGVHSHENHFYEVIRLLAEARCKSIVIHVFLDGRDVPPKSALGSLTKLLDICQAYPQVKIASLCGRYYAMDRDERWDRIQRAYNVLTMAQTSYVAPDALTALAMAYERGETDEFVQPTWIEGASPIDEGDVVFFMNFRSDRARQLSRAFLQAEFEEFKRFKVPQLSSFISMTEYAKDIPSKVIFPPQDLINSLGEYLSLLKKTQLRIAETEKYAHVTFFFNGGKEEIFPGEERILVPSPRVATYDLQPAMSALLVTEKLIEAINLQHFDVIIANYANPDMLGHTGNFAATIQGLEIVDQCLQNIWQALKLKGGEMIITSDHGNADCMFNSNTNQQHTAHTTALVPLLYVGRPAIVLNETGTLADIAPTLLSLMDLPQPSEMTGRAMFKITDNS